MTALTSLSDRGLRHVCPVLRYSYSSSAAVGIVNSGLGGAGARRLEGAIRLDAVTHIGWLHSRNSLII